MGLTAFGTSILLACAQSQPPSDRPAPAATASAPVAPWPAAPEGASGWRELQGWTFQRQAVAAANPLAAEAGAQMLREGGSAVDAAVAAQMVLGLVEPQSSGIGGGGLMLVWDGRNVQAWDGRETAPAAADERLFLRADGRPMTLAQAVPGGLSVGVPGVLKMLEAVHREHGRLPWARLFAPAITLAEQGFAVSPRLHSLLAQSQSQSARLDARALAFYFQPPPAPAASAAPVPAQPWPVGHVLRNPALAAVLRQVAQYGSAAFYQGQVAEDLVRRVREHPRSPGRLAPADLRAYQAVQRAPICTDWQQRWRVCGFPPPSSGHLAIMQILGMLDAVPGGAAAAWPAEAGRGPADPLQPLWLHQYFEASRLAWADRARYVADPAFVPAPAGDWQSLLAPDYLRQRAALIGPRAASGEVAAGEPGPATARQQAFAPQAEQPEHGTSHLSVVDARGQAVAFTTTIEAGFGSGILADGGTGLAGGYLLNNQLTDFSFLPADAQGRPVANRVQPGKRPRSSMSPTLVFDRQTGALQVATGSPGGAAIIHFTAKMLLGTLPWGLDAQQAANLPNFGLFGGPAVLEAGRFPPATLQALRERGHSVVETDLTSGAHAVQRRGDGWFGGADPRREGSVAGQ